MTSFDLKNFSQSNQFYDFERLISINRKWIRHLPEEQYLSEVEQYFKFVDYSFHVPVQLRLVLKNHIDTLGDLIRKISVLYDQSETMVQVIQNEIGSERVVLKKIYDECVKCSHWTQEDLKSVIVKSAIDFWKKTMLRSISYCIDV